MKELDVALSVWLLSHSQLVGVSKEMPASEDFYLYGMYPDLLSS
jgi:hypothetical protein